MTKRSATVIAAGLVLSMMAGMVGAVRQVTASHGTPQAIIVRTAPGPATPPVTEPSGEEGD